MHIYMHIYVYIYIYILSVKVDIFKFTDIFFYDLTAFLWMNLDDFHYCSDAKNRNYIFFLFKKQIIKISLFPFIL